MTAIDPTELRVFVYDRILSRGLSPRLAEIATEYGVSAEVARRELASLNIGKTILPDPGSGEIWMAGPFSAMETDYRVESGNGVWWANCAWDALGISMVMKETVRIQTTCGDCGDSITTSCDPNTPPDGAEVVHFLVPARLWYQDIGFT